MPRPISKLGPWLMAVVFCALAGCDGTGPALLAEDRAVEVAEDSKAGSVSAQPDCPTPDDADEFADQLLRLINIERFDVGVVALDAKLSAVAESYACIMITDDFFGHTHPKAGGIAERVSAAGYEYNLVGENLAAGIWTVPETVDAWLQSPAHRDVLLDPAFTKIGIAVRYGGRYGIYYVLILADPAE